jgi:hypothetical protein
MFEEPIVGSEEGEEGNAGSMLEGRGKIPERGLCGLVPGGREEGRVELGLGCKFGAPLVVWGVGLGEATG